MWTAKSAARATCVADASTEELPHLIGVEGRRYRPAQALAILGACAKPARSMARGSTGQWKPG